TAAPVFMAAVTSPAAGGRDAAGATAQTVYLGVGPEILALKRDWRIEGSFPARPGDLLVGADLAKARAWEVGRSVALPGLPGQRGRVTGVLAPTSGPDDLFVYMLLADAQRLFHQPGHLTHILVRLDDPDRMQPVVGDLRGCDAGLEMNIVP